MTALGQHAEVVGETSAERALAHLSNGDDFDAVVCDVMMSGMTGVDLHERIARERPALATRFVFVTGGTYTARERTYLEQVSNARLTKPFAIADLLRAIDGVSS